MRIGVPAETRAGEARVAATAETVKKLAAGGHQLLVEHDAGLAASQTDEAYTAAGATIVNAAEALGAEMVLKVRAPSPDELHAMRLAVKDNGTGFTQLIQNQSGSQQGPPYFQGGNAACPPP